MLKEQFALLELIRIGLTGKQNFSSILLDTDSNELIALASKQGVSCLCMNALEVLHKHDVHLWSKQTKLQLYAWQQQVMTSSKKHYKKAILFAESVAPLQIAVLKGLDYAQFWPNPLWREFGDLDCKLIGEDSHILDEKCRELNYDVNNHDYKHTEICHNGFVVENHHFFTSFGGSKDATIQEDALQKLFKGSFRRIGDSKLFSPNVNFTAVFLLAHAQNHFFYEGLNMRQVLDWHFFLTKEGENVDWNLIEDILEKIKLKTFAILLTQICKKYFDLKFEKIYKNSPCNDELMTKFLFDIFNDPYNQKRSLLPMIGRMFHRLHRTIKFRELNKMSITTSIWRWIAYTSYLNRRPKLK